MHFTMMVALPEWQSVYEALYNYCESIYERDDKGVYWPDWEFYPDWKWAPYTFYDWLEVGWRRDGYIKWKRWTKPYLSFNLGDKQEKYPDINWKNRWAAFIKKDIKWFWHHELTKYPETHTYFDLNYLDEIWCLDEYPQERDFKLTTDWEDRSYDEEAYKKACEEYKKREAKWYKSIPDDYVIYLIDYHN